MSLSSRRRRRLPSAPRLALSHHLSALSRSPRRPLATHEPTFNDLCEATRTDRYGGPMRPPSRACCSPQAQRCRYKTQMPTQVTRHMTIPYSTLRAPPLCPSRYPVPAVRPAPRIPSSQMTYLPTETPTATRELNTHATRPVESTLASTRLGTPRQRLAARSRAYRQPSSIPFYSTVRAR